MSDTAPDLGTMVSKLLADPTLLSQIASAVGVGNAATEGGNETASAPSVDTPPSSDSEKTDATGGLGGLGGLDGIAPLLSLLGSAQSSSSTKGSAPMHGDAARRVALLSALKPFCNSHRCRTIDYMISISKLSDTLMSGRG